MKDYSEVWHNLFEMLLQGQSGYNPSLIVDMTNQMMKSYMARIPQVREKYGAEYMVLWTKFFISCAGNGFYANGNRVADLADEAMGAYLQNKPELKKLKLIAFT